MRDFTVNLNNYTGNSCMIALTNYLIDLQVAVENQPHGIDLQSGPVPLQHAGECQSFTISRKLEKKGRSHRQLQVPEMNLL